MERSYSNHYFDRHFRFFLDFAPEQRVSIANTSPFLYYTRQDYADVVRRQCSDPSHCSFDEEAEEYIWSTLSIHTQDYKIAGP